MRGPGGITPPFTPLGGPYLLGLFSEIPIVAPVPGRGVPRWVVESDQPLYNFAHYHMREKFVILEEGNRPYPRCPQCDMFVPQKSLNCRYLAMAFCQRGADRKWWRLAEEEARAGTDMEFIAYEVLLAPFTHFKYLGQVLAAEDDDWPEVVRNLWRARLQWARLTRILSREGVEAHTSGHIYLAVVKLVVIYGLESWVLTQCMKRALG